MFYICAIHNFFVHCRISKYIYSICALYSILSFRKLDSRNCIAHTLVNYHSQRRPDLIFFFISRSKGIPVSSIDWQGLPFTPVETCLKIIGTPVTTCLEVTGTPVKTCWDFRSRNYLNAMSSVRGMEQHTPDLRGFLWDQLSDRDSRLLRWKLV